MRITIASVGGTRQSFEGYSTFLTTRLVGLGLAAVGEGVFGLVAVVVVVDLDLALAELELVLLVLGADFALDLDRVAAADDLVLELEEERVVLAALVAEDRVRLATADFTTDDLRLPLLADSSGIEFCGGWSFLAITGISSVLSSCGEGDLPLFLHFEGLSAQAST